MSYRFGQIIRGLAAAGKGSFQISLSEDGEWTVAAVYGREATAASYGADVNPWTAIRQVLDETRWDEL